METTPVPEADTLIYNPSFMSVDSPDGLWLCTDVEDAQVIGANAAALPLGGGLEELREAEAFFEAFPFVLVVGADRNRREDLARLLRRALPSLEICVTEQAVYRDCANLTELKDRYGLRAVEELWKEQHELPPWGLLDIGDVRPLDLLHQEHLPSGLPALDRLIGGFYGGEVSVWTGKRKEGKSTLMGLPILSALKRGKRVCVYSGELPAWRYKDWLVNMAAGRDNLLRRESETGREVWTPRPEVAAQIDLWWKGRLFLVDNVAEDIHQSDKLLQVFRYCAKRYRCSTFVVDNLMTVELPEKEYYRAQGQFVGRLTDFAHETGAHVHLVAHRRKGQGKGEADDVCGSAEITNRADNVFQISRESLLDVTCDATLTILSNRDFGVTGELPLRFDPVSRRFYSGMGDWKAGWEG